MKTMLACLFLPFGAGALLAGSTAVGGAGGGPSAHDSFFAEAPIFADAAARAGASAAEITEWEVPWENTRPRDPYVDGAGRVWFVGQRGDYLAYLVPRSGDFHRFDLDLGAGPHNVIVDGRGQAWYAGNRSAHIGRLDPESGRITKYPMPDPDALDPHTLQFDGRGHIWFTLQGSNMVGRLTMATGDIELVRMPTDHSRPYGLNVDSSGRPWFNQLGVNQIGTIDPVTLEVREYTLPRPGARTRRIEIASDDMVWYVDWAGAHLGRLDPATGSVREWATPSGPRARPYGMAIDDLDRLWFVESGVSPNLLIGFDPATERFFGAEPVEAGTVRHMVFHAPSRTIWFGTDTNMIARATVP